MLEFDKERKLWILQIVVYHTLISQEIYTEKYAYILRLISFIVASYKVNVGQVTFLSFIKESYSQPRYGINAGHCETIWN